MEEHYPHAQGICCGRRDTAKRTRTNSQTPEGGTRVTLLIEFWYKRYDAGSRRTFVHMAQFAGHALLFSTETGYGAERRGISRRRCMRTGNIPLRYTNTAIHGAKPFGKGLIHDY